MSARKIVARQLADTGAQIIRTCAACTIGVLVANLVAWGTAAKGAPWIAGFVTGAVIMWGAAGFALFHSFRPPDYRLPRITGATLSDYPLAIGRAFEERDRKALRREFRRADLYQVRFHLRAAWEAFKSALFPGNNLR